MSTGGTVAEARVDRVPPRWWTMTARWIVGVATLCCLGLLWSSMAREDLAVPLLLTLALAVTGVVWLVWALLGAFVHRSGWISLAAPGVVLVTAALLWSEAPRALGWWLSESAMERAALACDSADEGRIGVYPVTNLRRADNGCLLTVPGMDLLGPAGYAYLPQGAPPAQGDYDEEYEHVEGHWYTFTVRF
ncbi:hypothetical protein FEK33_21795 [Nocardia asteroides NBRC 15531]|uniref:Uncharacterized protein n=1 Tax=Nocardia asteroides NBRC 15531 TaxID=1110697 RepID=U5ECP4_NOCAS|nr:hypothetical protein [Nocardia asteroides]TLF64285.1 hypothetical protein FEK33_21795 [Nocardia asteroides NBRC 15531]UGT50610.1 hypothetical protein LT345_08675 [Nocardia asteroides]GAD84161.1 hypothetical protein NCAST_21_01110 [Nocardia asteroides NBRC 15531]